MFAAPAFLLGLLAIGLPIWLHRIARADPTRQPFASLMFLRRAEALRTSKHSIRYWLLLLLRVLLLIAIILAFAGPLLPAESMGRMSNTQLHAIVIDRSLSMQHGQAWQRTTEAAQKVIDSASPDDQLLLVGATGRRIEIVHGPVRGNERGAVRAALNNMQPSLGRLDYGFLMSTANSWLGAQRPPTQLHLITDLQQSATPLQFADLEPPENTQLNLVHIAHEGQPNSSIRDVTFAESTPRALEARVNGAQGTKKEVVLLVDGAQVERLPVEFDEGGEERIAFAPHDFGRGAHRVEVRLEPGDDLAADDRYSVVVEQSNPAVLLVAHNTNSDEVAYLAAAIESLPSPRLDVQRVTSNALAGEQLSRYAAVVISDSSTLSDVARSQVRDYADAGGAVLVTIGSQVTTPSTEAVTGLDIREVVQDPDRVATVEESHPILRNADPWRSIRFFRHVRVSPAEQDKVLLALEDGAPLLVERTLGQGRMLLLTVPLHREWSDLATHPLFVRFIGDAAAYLTASNAWPMSATIDQGVATGLTASAGGQIFDPVGKRVVGLAAASDFSRLVPDQIGFYEVRRGDEVKWLAVNVDPRESNLSRMTEDSVQRWLKLRSEAPTAATASDTQLASDARRSIGWWVLILAALLLALEFIFANHYLAVRREVPT